MPKSIIPVSLTVLAMVALSTAAMADPVAVDVIEVPYELPVTDLVDEVDIIDDFMVDESEPETLADIIEPQVPHMVTYGVELPPETLLDMSLDFDSFDVTWDAGAELTLVGVLPEGVTITNLSEGTPELRIQGYSTPEMLGEYPVEIWLTDISTGIKYDMGELVFSVYNPIDVL